MAKDGGVFSLMNTSLEPLYCFHLASSDERGVGRAARLITEFRPTAIEPAPRAVAAPPPSSRNRRRPIRR